MAGKRDGIQERKNSDGTIGYRAQVRLRGFPAQSQTFKRKTDAKAWIERTKTNIRDGNAITTEGARTTLREGLQRYLNEITPQKKGARREQDRVHAWIKNPLSARFMAHLKGSDFAAYR